jgi:hypothetical protein
MKTKLTLLATQQDFSTNVPLPMKITIIEGYVVNDYLLTTRFHDGGAYVIVAMEILNDDGTPL